MKAWSFYIEPKVFEMPGIKYDAGTVIMGHKPRSNLFNPSAASDPFLRMGHEETKQPERLKFSIEECGKELNLSLTKNKLFD